MPISGHWLIENKGLLCEVDLYLSKCLLTAQAMINVASNKPHFTNS